VSGPYEWMERVDRLIQSAVWWWCAVAELHETSCLFSRNNRGKARKACEFRIGYHHICHMFTLIHATGIGKKHSRSISWSAIKWKIRI